MKKEPFYKEFIIKEKIAMFHPSTKGFVFWFSRGVSIMEKMKSLILNNVKKHYCAENGFNLQIIETPQLVKEDVFKKSGHTENFKDNMFKVESDMYLKPMSCPLHYLLIDRIKHEIGKNIECFFEFGRVLRKEASGSGTGLLRLRGFTQDDMHIVCGLKDLTQVVRNFINTVKDTYKELIKSKISFHHSTPKIQSDDLSYANSQMSKVLNELDVEFEISEGEGAFYAPKLDVMAGDWQLGTLQLDLVSLKKFGINVINSEEKIVIHQAVLGSLERFLAISIEENRGLPSIINDKKYAIIPINKKSEIIMNFVHGICKALKDDYKIFMGDFKTMVSQAKSKGFEHVLVVGDKDVELGHVEINGKKIFPLQ